MNNDYWHHKQEIPQYEKVELLRLIEEKLKTIEQFFEVDCFNYYICKVDPDLFERVYNINKEYLYKGDLAVRYEEYNYNKCDCYISEDGLAGYAITNNHWLVSVFSNSEQCGFLNKFLPGIDKVTKLECLVGSKNCDFSDLYENGTYNISSNLVNKYFDLGFRIIAKTNNDIEQFIKYYGQEFTDNFIKYYGQPHHLFMIRGETNQDIIEDEEDETSINGYSLMDDSNSREIILYKFDKKEITESKSFADRMKQIITFDDYFEAERYVDRLID